MSRYGGGEKCPKCNKTVYMAEEVVAAGKKFHKMCCKCTDCNKMLDSTTIAENDGNLYCPSCHRRNFGIKGYGYGGGAGTLASECRDNKNRTDGGPPSGGSYSSTGYGVSKGGAKTGGGGCGAASFGSSDRCPRCEKSVYAAEKVVGAGSAWHKACFGCALCQKKLDSSTMADKDGEIYCKACYGKEFGPKGFGFGQGAGTLSTT